MYTSRHIFHTKHDFTPELAWNTFQLLADLGGSNISIDELQQIAHLTASPLSKRSEPNKLLASMEELGIIERQQNILSLTEAGMSLRRGIGGYEAGFRAAVHCLYSWQWLWHNKGFATPSWSYREVCRQLLAAGSVGVSSDELVLRVVAAAEKFQTSKVSFSRSSVLGVANWLMGQMPPLLQKKGEHWIIQSANCLMTEALRLHLTAGCAYYKGELVLSKEYLQFISEPLLTNYDDLLIVLTDYVRNCQEFMYFSGNPAKVKFKNSDDPFIEWMIKNCI